MKKGNILVEKFDVNPYQGIGAFVCACRKKGYEVINIERKDTNATVTYRKSS